MINILTIKPDILMFLLHKLMYNLRCSNHIMKHSLLEIKKMVIQLLQIMMHLTKDLLKNILNLRLDHSKLNGLLTKKMKLPNRLHLMPQLKLKSGNSLQILIGIGLVPNM
jgi:hypothetical protein